MKSWLQDNDIETYSKYNEGKSVVSETFIRTKITKFDDVVNKYNNAYHSSIKTKPVDGKSSKYIDFGIENSDPKLDPKFEVGDQVRISKCKNVFAKDYTPNWFEEVFVIKKSENVVPWTCVIEHLNGEQIANVLRKIIV